MLGIRQLTALFSGKTRPMMHRIKPGSLLRLGVKDDPNGDAFLLVHAVRPKTGWLSGLFRWAFGKKRFMDVSWVASKDPTMPLSKIRELAHQAASEKGMKRLNPEGVEQWIWNTGQQGEHLVNYAWTSSLKLVEGFFGRVFIRDAEGRSHRIDKVFNFLRKPASAAGETASKAG